MRKKLDYNNLNDICKCNNYINSLTQNQLNDKIFMLSYLKNNENMVWHIFYYISKIYGDDKDFILKIFKFNLNRTILTVYHQISENLQQDRDIVLLLVKNHDDVILKLYAKNLLADKEIRVAELKKTIAPFVIYNSLPTKLKDDKDIILSAFENIIKRDKKLKFELKNKKYKGVLCTVMEGELGRDLENILEIIPDKFKEYYNKNNNIDDFIYFLKGIPNFINKNIIYDFDNKVTIKFIYDEQVYLN